VVSANCNPPGAPQLLIGILGVVLVLLLIERTAPQYATVYIFIVALGLILAHAGCFAQFAASVQALAQNGVTP
jgi:predicted membrane channel-forming protein YqfA (hemolysin III family)